jgi:hypothetical protein
VEWFYAKNNQQRGPVSPAELRQLAQSGQLAPEDLVWRQGLDDWTAASRVKGLFDGEPSAAVRDTPPSETAVKEPPAPVRDTPPHEAAAKEPPATVRDTPAPVTAVKEPPLRLKIHQSPPKIELNGSRGVFEDSPVDDHKSPRPPMGHVLDHLLRAAKGRFTSRFVETTAQIFRTWGYYGLYAAMITSAAFAAVAAAHQGMIEGVVLALAAIPLLAVLQYVAGRFLEALERLNRATPGRLDSSAVLDCFALLSFFVGTAALIGLAILAVKTQMVSMVLSAVAVFTLSQYVAVIALNPDSISITLGNSGGAGEEALALISCLLKMTLRIVPVAFGVGIAWGTVALMYAVAVTAVAGDSSVPLALSTARQAMAGLCSAAVLPVATYVAFLVLHLGIDVLRGLVHLADLGDRRSSGR